MGSPVYGAAVVSRFLGHPPSGDWYERTGEDLLARAFQHEIDHLNGKLYIHHLSSLKRDMMRRKIRRLQRHGEW